MFAWHDISRTSWNLKIEKCRPQNLNSHRKKSLLICQGRVLAAVILLPALLQAQNQPRKPVADSLHVSVADSARQDTTGLVSNTKSFVDSIAAPKFVFPRIGFATDTAAVSKHFFQDFIELAGQTLPLIPVITGEAGQPRYLATGDLPARAMTIVVDDVAWIPGVYGVVDLTSLPDAQVNIIEAGSIWPREPALPLAPMRIHLAGDSLRYQTPFSRIEYAKGALGADAVRIKFGRALGKRLSAYVNSTFSNAEAHAIAINDSEQVAVKAYDGHKAGAQLDYHLNAQWKLRYRHFNTRNEAGMSAPFFPEEWPGINDALHKEERLYHALELSDASHISLRGFFWQIKEELNDPELRLKHRLRDGGVEMRWAKETEAWALRLQNRFGLEAIKSDSIADRERFYDNISIALGRRMTPKLWLHLNGNVAHKSDWPLGASLKAQIIARHNQSLTWWLAGGFWKIPPALGERDNNLSFLMTNEDLQAVNLQRGEAGIKWQRQRFDLQLLLSSSVWHDGLIYQTNSRALFNNNRSKSILAARLALHWEFASSWHLGAIAAQAVNELPHDYWFWHQPEGYGRVYLETQKSFFGGDLEILPRLAGRFIGRRYSPRLDTAAVKLPDHTLPKAAVLDFQIRLRHGDGALMFSWENLLDQKFDWRYNVPGPRRFLRWGFWWNFWN
jgi:hypothetical protein